MTEEDVLAILGPPFFGATASYDPEITTLTYSKPAYFAKWYPMLWVHLRDGRVRGIYAKRYSFWGEDDLGVYGSGIGGHWETDMFERTFPPQASQ